MLLLFPLSSCWQPGARSNGAEKVLHASPHHGELVGSPCWGLLRTLFLIGLTCLWDPPSPPSLDHLLKYEVRTAVLQTGVKDRRPCGAV